MTILFFILFMATLLFTSWNYDYISKFAKGQRIELILYLMKVNFIMLCLLSTTAFALLVYSVFSNLK